MSSSSCGPRVEGAYQLVSRWCRTGPHLCLRRSRDPGDGTPNGCDTSSPPGATRARTGACGNGTRRGVRLWPLGEERREIELFGADVMPRIESHARG